MHQKKKVKDRQGWAGRGEEGGVTVLLSLHSSAPFRSPSFPFLFFPPCQMSSFPLSTVQRTLTLLSSSSVVDLVIQSHADRWFVILTQYGKLGTLVRELHQDPIVNDTCTYGRRYHWILSSFYS